MVIVGFTDKTSVRWVRILCRHFKHCAIITKHGNKMFLHQFVKRSNVIKIAITKRGITQLSLYGWVFIYLDTHNPTQFNTQVRTCVQYVKDAIGIKNFLIQTPNALYKYLKKNLT